MGSFSIVRKLGVYINYEILKLLVSHKLSQGDSIDSASRNHICLKRHYTVLYCDDWYHCSLRPNVICGSNEYTSSCLWIYGIWIGFLLGRNMHVSVDRHFLKLHNISIGVPQGSTLAPTLFLTHISDLLIATINLILIFADDSTVHFSNRLKATYSYAWACCQFCHTNLHRGIILRAIFLFLCLISFNTTKETFPRKINFASVLLPDKRRKVLTPIALLRLLMLASVSLANTIWIFFKC